MQVVILAAGQGVRLNGYAPIKPLAPMAGRPLIRHVLDRLAAAGGTEAVIVTGFSGDVIRAALADTPLPVRFVENPGWSGPNGLSLLAAAPLLADRALLVMADHLVDPALYHAVWEHPLGDDALALGVDRRLGHPNVDETDVTRVATRGDRIVGIGKTLATYDAYDTGVFQITPALGEALAALPAPSLSDGVRALARAGRAAFVETGSRDWLDIDDARALRLAKIAVGEVA